MAAVRQAAVESKQNPPNPTHHEKKSIPTFPTMDEINAICDKYEEKYRAQPGYQKFLRGLVPFHPQVNRLPKLTELRETLKTALQAENKANKLFEAVDQLESDYREVKAEEIFHATTFASTICALISLVLHHLKTHDFFHHKMEELKKEWATLQAEEMDIRRKGGRPEVHGTWKNKRDTLLAKLIKYRDIDALIYSYQLRKHDSFIPREKLDIPSESFTPSSRSVPCEDVWFDIPWIYQPKLHTLIFYRIEKEEFPQSPKAWEDWNLEGRRRHSSRIISPNMDAPGAGPTGAPGAGPGASDPNASGAGGQGPASAGPNARDAEGVNPSAGPGPDAAGEEVINTNPVTPETLSETANIKSDAATKQSAPTKSTDDKEENKDNSPQSHTPVSAIHPIVRGAGHVESILDNVVTSEQNRITDDSGDDAELMGIDTLHLNTLDDAAQFKPNNKTAPAPSASPKRANPSTTTKILSMASFLTETPPTLDKSAAIGASASPAKKTTPATGTKLTAAIAPAKKPASDAKASNNKTPVSYAAIGAGAGAGASPAKKAVPSAGAAPKKSNSDTTNQPVPVSGLRL